MTAARQQRNRGVGASALARNAPGVLTRSGPPPTPSSPGARCDHRVALAEAARDRVLIISPASFASTKSRRRRGTQTLARANKKITSNFSLLCEARGVGRRSKLLINAVILAHPRSSPLVELCPGLRGERDLAGPLRPAPSRSCSSPGPLLVSGSGSFLGSAEALAGRLSTSNQGANTCTKPFAVPCWPRRAA